MIYHGYFMCIGVEYILLFYIACEGVMKKVKPRTLFINYCSCCHVVFVWNICTREVR
jgi:hypothetical protein